MRTSSIQTVIRLNLVVVLLPVMMPTSIAASENTNISETAIPVFKGDSARPYIVVGEIKDNLRKPFALMANPSEDKILAEIWERARKMGADAVINARFGKTERTILNHGRTPISGTAIKYTDGKR